jgi:hypothetical protein
MQKPRIGHSATMLTDGKVLIAGGYTPACAGCIVVPDNTAELYDPATGGVFHIHSELRFVRFLSEHGLLRQVFLALGNLSNDCPLGWRAAFSSAF